ncbi:MAG: hypothetical protein LKF01_01265 [Lactobacillus sp.]|jgi:Arc/MetJ family transcription regulator|nr:hypothetical protein [Lactobacillus sp.]MCH4068167.1 hypothetical protein [Lactobacillus sp.]MCI1304348.1 hypothetical protein [Lactobacillus sp.]MCI1330098.1 hypothetical protein [Lactobacillus sp.]MCI1360017.1 hypothetical protein [Lactobacillus sp.]
MTDTMMTNPFMPSFGRFPKIVIDQQEALTDYLTGLQTHDAKYQTSLVYGTRGAGKTVFLLNVQKSLKQLNNWCFIRLNNGQGNLLFQLLHGLQKATGTSLLDLMKSVKSVSLMGNSLSWQTLEASNLIDYDEYLSELLKRLKKQGKSVLIGIDEIEISDDVRAFGSEYQTLIGDDYDISLLMTGLPSRISEVQNDDTLTFLLRSNRVYLSPLDQASIASSYETAFKRGKRKIDYGVLDQLSRAVKGYAYAFQTIGYYAWRYSQDSLQIDDEVLAKTIQASKTDLFRNAYEKMYLDLSNTDRAFIEAMIQAKSSLVSMKQLQAILHKPINYISVYRARLLDAQLINSPQRGFVQLSLPFFAEFVEKYKQEHFA